MKDRLDLLAEADPGGTVELRIDALAQMLEYPGTVVDLPTGPEPEPPVDQPAGKQVFSFRDLSRQHVSAPVRIPDSCRIEWNYQTSEPPATEGPIQLVIFEAYIGEEWIGRERFTIAARRGGGKNRRWRVSVGWGRVEAGAAAEDGWNMNWFSRASAVAPWSDVTNGGVEIHHGEVVSSLGFDAVLLDTKGNRVRFVPSGREWRVQVGHEDSAKGQAGRGDEPFVDGSGELVIYDLATVEDDEPTGEYPAVPLLVSDLPDGVMSPTDLDEAMTKTVRTKSSWSSEEGPSGAPAVDCKALREVASSVLYYLEKWIATGAIYVRFLPLRRGPDALDWWLDWTESCRHCGVNWAYTEEQMRGFFALSELPEVAIGQRYVPVSAAGRKVALINLPGMADYLVKAVRLSQDTMDNWRAVNVGAIADAAYDLAVREADVLDEQGHIDRHPLWRRWLK